MRTAGIDIATHTGMAVTGEGEDRGKAIYVYKQKGFLRLQLIAQEVLRTLDIWEPDLVVIEDYAFSRNVSSFVTLVELGTAIRMALYQHHIHWVDVNVQTLKNWLLEGHQVPKYPKGTKREDKKPEHLWGSKAMMAEVCGQKWGFVSPSDDVIDAFCLAKMGQIGPDLMKMAGVSSEFPLQTLFFGDTVTT